MSLREAVRIETTGQRVVRQLCEALIFEGLCKLAPNIGIGCWTWGGTTIRAKITLGGFNRPRITPGSVQIQCGTGWAPASATDLLATAPIAEAMRQELAEDLHRSEALTDLTGPDVHQRGLRSGMSCDALESALHEGHPYHPCFKARSGFSDKDHLIYGPEAGRCFQLEWLAVDQTLVDQSLPDRFLDTELDAATRLQLCAQATAKGVTLAAHTLVPVHPWQQRALQGNAIYQAWRDAGRITHLGAFGDRYRATQSVRTLANADHPNRAHVKMAMAMRNTSSLRIIEPHSVCAAPAISDWLVTIIANDPVFSDTCRLTLLREYAGIIVGRDTPLSGHLAAIYRDSPQGAGLNAHQVMPLNALAVTEASGEPLIAPWVQRYGIHVWVDQVLRTTVLPIWHLMVAHGIGLEAHGQNLLLEHDNGWPIGLIARDFHESVEYVPDLLSQPDLVPDLAAIDPVYANAAPGQFHRMAGGEDLRELVMDTLFVYNLSELAALLQRHYGLTETLFWQRVRTVIDQHVARRELKARQAAFAPFVPSISTESLLTLKLNGGTGVFRHTVPNPLCTTKG
ncbi:IucA/IucC family protein [Tateyamaria sp. ANG-S1]|uniref:IucA/IucC family protein n=1 Tax=Tateyamaria sp. ANG-S1 TaxID=1577905 RepID=UPI00057FB582|nr:IucA/IucC family protein [Tateyamaria sp. ANG-S1]KIC47849.1 siderophore biosynthesis protein [Tateyamaria sp. ANG-S1]